MRLFLPSFCAKTLSRRLVSGGAPPAVLIRPPSRAVSIPLRSSLGSNLTASGSHAPPQPAANSSKQDLQDVASIGSFFSEFSTMNAAASLPLYSQFPLNKAVESRKDPTQLSTWLNSTTARLIVFSGPKCLIRHTSTSDAAAQDFLPSNTYVPGGPAASPFSPLSSATPPLASMDSYGFGSSLSSIDFSRSDGHPKVPVFLEPASSFLPVCNQDIAPIFLGLDEANVPYFVADILPEKAAEVSANQRADWCSLRSEGPNLEATDAALLAVASGLISWHRGNIYSGVSGAKTEPTFGGFSRRDPASTKTFYPRIDPAVIMLITSGDWCLLGRKPEWAECRYSCLAGFLEIGETLEMAVKREVMEEANVDVDLNSIRYFRSQPWPFPQSLMVGFYGTAVSEPSADPSGFDLLPATGRQAALEVGVKAHEVDSILKGVPPKPIPDRHELSDARWFHRDFLHSVFVDQLPLNCKFSIPGAYAVAHTLIANWVDGQGNYSSALSQLPQVQISPGKAKYVLLRAYDAAGNSKLLVRSDHRAAYHMHVYEKAKAQATKLGLQVDVLGGGRIDYSPEHELITVYGYSQAFGPAPHELSAALLKKWYPLLEEGCISISYEGY